jgi:hypothetical protein
VIARFRILLPYGLYLRSDGQLSPHRFTYGLYQIAIHPPYQAVIDPSDAASSSEVAARDILEQLEPASPPKVSQFVLMDEISTVHANMLQIDFHKDDFDRRPATVRVDQSEDPLIALAFELVNAFLASIRSATKAGHIKPLEIRGSNWRLDYLTDDYQEFQPEADKIRREFGSSFGWKICGINEEVWSKAHTLSSSYRPSNWENLILDAEVLLPEVGPALVLAVTALETLISVTLNHLASSANLPAGLWEWINNRGDYRKEPSVEEQFDVLLRVLADKSLRNQSDLWRAFKDLKEARNSFVHGGVAVIRIGKKKKTEKVVTQELAYTLVRQAREIIDWVESLLPSELRRPKLEHQPQFKMFKIISPPTTSGPTG